MSVCQFNQVATTPCSDLLPPRSGQRFHPTVHSLFCPIKIRLREKLQRIHSVDWIDWAVKILLVAERNSRIDAHPAFKAGVRSSPLFLARGHAFLRLKRLPATAWQWIADVSVAIHPRCQRRDSVIHPVYIG